MSVGVVGHWLTKKWETQFTQEVECGLTNFKKVLVFSSDCCTARSVLWLLWESKITSHDKLASRCCRWVSFRTCRTRMWLCWQSTNATSAKASTQQACPRLLKEKRLFHSLESSVTHTRALPHGAHTHSALKTITQIQPSAPQTARRSHEKHEQALNRSLLFHRVRRHVAMTI